MAMAVHDGRMADIGVGIGVGVAIAVFLRRMPVPCALW